MTIHVNNFLSWTAVRDVYVNNGGTWQRAREVYVNNGGTWQRVHNSGLVDAVMVAGQNGGLSGYISGSFGSLTPNTIPDGLTVNALYHAESGIEINQVGLQIVGFSANPGASWLQALTISGFGTISYSGATFGYGSSTASWTWDFIGTPFLSGGVYTISIVPGS